MAERFLPLDDPFTQFIDREDIERSLAEEFNEIAEQEQAAIAARARRQAVRATESGVAPAGVAPSAVTEPSPADSVSFGEEALRATVGGVLGEIRDIVVNVDNLTEAALTGLGILEPDEQEGLFNLQSLLPEIAEPESIAGGLIRGLVEFGTGYLLFGGIGRKLGLANEFARATFASAAQAGLGRGENEQRATDSIAQIAPSLTDDRVIGGLVQFLQSSDEESAIERFGKDVLEDVLLGLGIEGGVQVAKRFTDAIRTGELKGLVREELGAVGPRSPGDPEPLPPRQDSALADENDAVVEGLTRTEGEASDRVAREVDTALGNARTTTEEIPLLKTPEEGGYSKAIIKTITKTGDEMLRRPRKVTPSSGWIAGADH